MNEGSEEELAGTNQARYKDFWKEYQLDDPKKWAHWEVIEKYLKQGVKALEIGSGPRPRIPIENSYFVDLDTSSLQKLKEAGGRSAVADFSSPLPFADKSMDVVCAFEVLEHVGKLERNNENLPDMKAAAAAVREIARVLKDEGHAFVSFPLHPKLFNEYDIVAGHSGRFPVERLEVLFHDNGLKIEQFAPMDVPWPDAKTAKVLAFMERTVPWFIPKVTKVLDNLPFTSLKKAIQLQPWSREVAPMVLNPVSTGFFVLKPIPPQTPLAAGTRI